MADFMKRKIITDSYEFPEGALKIYGGGKFYNGFSIAETQRLTVVNKDGLLKFSREALGGNVESNIIFGTIPPNNKKVICADVVIPLSQLQTNVYINDQILGPNMNWGITGVRRTSESQYFVTQVQAGGKFRIKFIYYQALPEMMWAVQALWIE